ncbi:MAG: DsrE/DsrF/DrsH-like family protein [Propionicimonas sp.]|uniref:DsrE/DsrF/DrsH-like family protein n=1 Tax=Propionicimonas sp. TaxID=1955623 RepID=UPI003D13ACE5
MTTTIENPTTPEASVADAPVPPPTPTRRKLVIICSKGNLDMAYPGLILGTAALGEGIETHLFFTFWGLDMITRERMDDLKFTPLGNTAMHLVQAPRMPIPALAGAIPGMTGMATKMMRKQIADLEIPTVPELLEQVVEMGGHLWACRMSFDMMNLTEADLFDGVEAVISATDFMEISEGGQVIFV